MGIIARQSIKASIVGLVGVAIGAFTRLFLYTKFLTASEIGILETVIKLGILMIPFFVVGAPQVVTRYFGRFKDQQSNDSLIFSYTVILGLFLIPLMSVLYYLFNPYLFAWYKEAPELADYAILPLLVAITFGGFALLRSISSVHLRITIPTFLSGVFDRVLVLVLLLAFGVMHWINIHQFIHLNIFVFFVVPFILMLGYLIFVIKPVFKSTSFHGVKKIFKKTAAYNSYLILGTLSGVIISAIDVNMISGKLGTELAGVYTIAFFMGSVIDIPRRSLSSIIYPILNKAVIAEDKLKIEALYQKSSVNQFLVGLFIFLVVWLNIDQVFQIIPNGSDYIGGKMVVLFIGLSKLFDMMMGVNKQIIELSKYYRLNLVINVLLSVLVIILNLIFIPLDSSLFGGINGVAFASLLAILISNLIAFIIVWKKEGLQPLTNDHLKILMLTVLSFILVAWINISNPWLMIVLKSAMLSILFVSYTLVFKISSDFSGLFEQLKERVKKS